MSDHSSATENLEDSLNAWLVERIAGYVGRAPEEIATDVSLSEYGLDSVFALTLTGELEEYLNVDVEPTVIWDHPTIEALSRALLSTN
jgi:acyl carrier protein